MVNISTETDVVRGDSPNIDGRENAGEPRRRLVVERLPLDIVATGNGGLGMVLIGHESHEPMDLAKNIMQASSIVGNKTNASINSAELFDINLPVFFARSTDHCSSFSHPFLLADYSAGIDDTYLICNSDTIYVLWQAVLKKGVMLFRRSTDGGQSFTKQVEIPGISMFHPTGHPVYNGSMVLTQDGNLMGAIRNDIKSPSGEPRDAGAEVIFTAIDKSGVIVESRKLSEERAQVAIFPSVASSGTNVYVAWSETSKGMPTSIKFRKATVNYES
jgi:hypothetical protein